MVEPAAEKPSNEEPTPEEQMTSRFDESRAQFLLVIPVAAVWVGFAVLAELFFVLVLVPKLPPELHIISGMFPPEDTIETKLLIMVMSIIIAVMAVFTIFAFIFHRRGDKNAIGLGLIVVMGVSYALSSQFVSSLYQLGHTIQMPPFPGTVNFAILFWNFAFMAFGIGTAFFASRWRAKRIEPQTDTPDDEWWRDHAGPPKP